MKNIAEINVNNLIFNAQNIKGKMKEGQKLFAVVKADAYGHGAERVSNYLYNYVDGYVVCTTEEGIGLRRSGIDKEILVLYGVIDEGDLLNATEYNLTVTIGCQKHLKIVKNASRISKKPIKVHIAVNTGMNRIGFDGVKQLKRVCKVLKDSKIAVEGIYSHYYNPCNKSHLISQQNKFNEYIAVAKEYFGSLTTHISASGGFIMGDSYDALRIGLLLYGYTPFNTRRIKVKPVMKVVTDVILTRRVAKNEHFLYGSDVMEKANAYTLIRYGYADGLNRCVSNERPKCMDICAVKGRYNNKFTLLYKNAVQLAKKYDTITYEVLTKIGSRCEKIYKR